MWNFMDGWDGWGAGWHFFGLMHVLWWVLVVFVLVYVIRGLRRGGPEDRAQSILRERYARGEIDRAEFDERMKVLKG